MRQLDLQLMGKMVFEMRRAHKMTQTELSKRADVSRTTISALENGTLEDIGVKRLSRLVEALKMGDEQGHMRDVVQLGVWLNEYRENVANQTISEFSKIAGILPEIVVAMEMGDGTVSIADWIMAFESMQVRADVMDAAKPGLALLGSMFDLAKSEAS